MTTSYTGSSAGLVARTDGIVTTEPADGDDLVASSAQVPDKKLADFLKLMQDKAGFINLANTWAALQTFSAGAAFPANVLTLCSSLTLGSNWSDASNPDLKARYYKNAIGELVLQGTLVVSGSSPASVAFTLPAGFRDVSVGGAGTAGRSFTVTREHGASILSAHVYTDVSGTIGPVVHAGDAAWATGDILWLDGIRYRTT